MSVHVACLWMCVLFSFSFGCLHVCVYVSKFEVHCGNAFEPGASGLPYYCTPPVCVPDVLDTLAVWRLTKKKNYKAIPQVIHTQSPCACFALCIVHIPQTQSETQLTSQKTVVDEVLGMRVCFLCLRAPCPYLRVPFVRACLAPDCTCLANACACVLFARVCQIVTPGDSRTIPLSVPYSAHCTWLHKHNMQHK